MSKRILLVDDDKTLREMFAIGLRIAGYDVVEAGSGDMVLELLGQQRFTATLIDVMMRGLSGFELLAEAEERGMRKEMGKVMMMTSLDKDILTNKLERYGIHRCLDKSQITPSHLVEIIRAL